MASKVLQEVMRRRDFWKARNKIALRERDEALAEVVQLRELLGKAGVVMDEDSDLRALLERHHLEPPK